MFLRDSHLLLRRGAPYASEWCAGCGVAAVGGERKWATGFLAYAESTALVL
jgi:hypothetical protein